MKKVPDLKKDFDKNYESGREYRKSKKKKKKVKDMNYWRRRYNKLVSFSFALYALCVIEYLKERDFMSISLLLVFGIIASGFAYHSKKMINSFNESNSKK